MRLLGGWLAFWRVFVPGLGKGLPDALTFSVRYAGVSSPWCRLPPVARIQSRKMRNPRRDISSTAISL